MKIARIRSGGQTGVDRAALNIARELNIPMCGWCPKGGWAEDFPEPPGVRELFPELIETPKGEVEQRTCWNVRDSHATLIISDGYSPGTKYTSECAKKMKRPLMIVSNEDDEDAIKKWLSSINGDELTLNIAGPRESESEGIYQRTYVLLKKLLKERG